MHSPARTTRIATIALALTALAALTACDRTSPTAPSAPAASVAPAASAISADRDGGDRDGRAIAFAPQAHPYGRSMIEWSEAWWRWELSVPTARNPSLDSTGEYCAAGQENEGAAGHVWYLGTTFGGAVTLTRKCTLPRGRALLVNLSGILNDYPCPDTTFHPKPGQSLYNFLALGAKQIVDGVDALTLTVDGRGVPDLFSYRDPTPLFSFTGNPTLATSIDACITGHPQPAVADGYFVMVKPLDPGTHTLQFTSHDTMGNYNSLTYDLTVLQDDDR